MVGDEIVNGNDIVRFFFRVRWLRRPVRPVLRTGSRRGALSEAHSMGRKVVVRLLCGTSGELKR